MTPTARALQIADTETEFSAGRARETGSFPKGRVARDVRRELSGSYGAGQLTSVTCPNLVLSFSPAIPACHP